MADTAQRTGAAALIAALVEQGVAYVFGIPGVHTLLPYDLLHKHPAIRPIVMRHEAAAGFAADGYARASGHPGVCLVVPGPGATNLGTAALVAKSDSVPLVLITAALPRPLLGRYALHDLDLDAFFRPLVKAQVAIDTASAGAIARAVARAFALARREPPGPVQLSCPYDLLGQPSGPDMIAVGRAATAPEPGDAAPVVPASAALERALGLLRVARAPLFYAGHGVVRAGAGPALVALAETLGAPVLTSNKARGIIPEDHPLAAGIPSMQGAAALLREADVCLALGTHFNEYTTLGWRVPLPRRLIRVDREPAVLQQNYPAEVGVAGDVALVLAWLGERLAARAAPSTLGAAHAALREQRRARAGESLAAAAAATPPFHPRVVAALLRELLPPDAILTSDGSSTESWLYESGFVVTRPGTIFVPEVQQTMGYGVGAALGAALGAPGRAVAAVVGDGSLLMTLGELAAIAAERVPLTIVVFNDGYYNALRLRQEVAHGRRYVGTALGTLDFAQMARGVGLRGERVAALEQFRGYLREAARRVEPLLLDVPVSPLPLSERYAAVVEAGG